MNKQWISASQKASLPIKWYDLVPIVVLVLATLLAIVGWEVFDGTRAL